MLLEARFPGLSIGNGCATGMYMGCPACDFTISKEKFEKIVNDLYQPKKYRSEEQNLSDLNNLGRKEISDFYE